MIVESTKQVRVETAGLKYLAKRFSKAAAKSCTPAGCFECDKVITVPEVFAV